MYNKPDKIILGCLVFLFSVAVGCVMEELNLILVRWTFFVLVLIWFFLRNNFNPINKEITENNQPEILKHTQKTLKEKDSKLDLVKKKKPKKIILEKNNKVQIFLESILKNNYFKAALVPFLFCFLFYSGIYLSQKKVEKLSNVFQGKFKGYLKISQESTSGDGYQKIIAEKFNPQKENKNLETFKSIFERETVEQKFFDLENLAKIKNKVVIFVPENLSFEYGRVIKVTCDLEVPENKFEKFNYVRFLAKDEIYQICKRSRVEKTDFILGNFFKKQIFNLRRKFENKISALFPAPESGYLAGLLIGGEDRLPSDVAENFRITGTTHTVAVSGSNIAIIAGFIMATGIFLGLWRGQAFYLAVSGVIVFVIMIGAPSSAVRAAIMGILMLWATKNGRLGNSLRSIFITAFLMVVYEPFFLLYDAGFALSFLATLGIILIYQPLSVFFKVKNDFLEIKSIILVTICAQAGVSGYSIYTFENFSFLSFPANLIILPAIPLLMLGGFFSVLTSFIFDFPAKILALLTFWGLTFEISAVNFLAQFSKWNLTFPGAGMKFVVVYYIILIGILLWVHFAEKVNGHLN